MVAFKKREALFETLFHGPVVDRLPSLCRLNP
jgi:hypothetical protein